MYYVAIINILAYIPLVFSPFIYHAYRIKLV